MREWIFNIWQLLKVCLGFIPALYMAMAAIILIMIFTIERLYFDGLAPGGYTIYYGSLDEARDLLNTLLQTMVTMTTLVITMTMLVVSLSASQLGPRLVKSFVSNRTTHQYVGYFFSAVILCAVLLGIIHNEDFAEPVPNFTISFVIFCCFLSFCMLLGFINHIARSCIADNMIFRVYKHLLGSIDRICVDEKKLLSPDLPTGFEKKRVVIHSDRSGFIQSINYQDLLKFAKNNDLVIKVLGHAGDYIISSQPLAEVYARGDTKIDDDLIEDVLSQMIVGDERTPTQDIEYSFRHLTEIGLRALSPGINDHVTAKLALNYITAGLVELSGRHLPNVVYNDEDDVCRIVGTPKYLQNIMVPAILPIMEAGQDKADIMVHVREKLELLRSGLRGQKVTEQIKLLEDIADQYIDLHFKNFKTLKRQIETL